MSAKAAYHHGNLRPALLDESLALVAEKGVDGLSLREVASRVGVSHAAPYHHFADKSALLVALAEEGHDLMAADMATAAEAAGDDPRERMLAIGLAYVRFAEHRPDYYAVLASPELASASSGSEAMADPGPLWQLLIGAVIACQRSGCLPEGDPVTAAVYLWSLVHGLAELVRAGTLAKFPQASADIDSFARQVLETGLAAAQPTSEGDS